ncbi:MAG: acyl-CoA thioesterase [Mycobacteriaceae bacterium]
MTSKVMQSDLRQMLGLFELEQVTENIYIGRHSTKNASRTAGSLLLAQTIVAAGRSVAAGLPMRSLSAHFIRGGDPSGPIEYTVTMLRASRGLANVRVDAAQKGNIVISTLVSFQDSAGGLEHGAQVPVVPHPESLPPLGEHFTGYEKQLAVLVNALRPIDIRFANEPMWVQKDSGNHLDYNRVWMKADGELPEDQILHLAAMGYASDTTVLDSIFTTHGLSWGIDRLVAATVNHSMWFHKPIRFDEWVLYETESPVAAESRGLATGRFFSKEGELLATVVQEGFIRYFPPKS